MFSVKLLVLVESYPSNNNRYPMAYVHSRLIEYIKYEGVSVTVLSFKADCDYIYEGIKVVTESSFDKKSLQQFDKVISHAPNIKNHARFIKKHKLKNVVFFIHGHEVLSIKEYYPPAYDWMIKSRMMRGLFLIYDYFKLPYIRNFFSSCSNFKFVFVSEWMRREANLSLGLKEKLLSTVIYNPVNQAYVINEYNKRIDKSFDFITVRPLDGSKYCLDLVVRIARANPNYEFKIIGKGQFFKRNSIPNNVKWINDFFTPEELISHFNDARVALMPTRLDAQGVMMCEIASFGMPIVTTDLEITREVLNGYENAYFIDNDFPEDTFNKLIDGVNIFDATSERELLVRRFNNVALTEAELDYIVK